eukprot:1431140-Lingulodinium_polyedra.AAC.1
MTGLSPVLGDLGDLAQEVLRIDYDHVRAHDGQPWNELADSLAKAASRGACFPPGPLTLATMLGVKELGWQWLVETNDSVAG